MSGCRKHPARNPGCAFCRLDPGDRDALRQMVALFADPEWGQLPRMTWIQEPPREATR